MSLCCLLPLSPQFVPLQFAVPVITSLPQSCGIHRKVTSLSWVRTCTPPRQAKQLFAQVSQCCKLSAPLSQVMKVEQLHWWTQRILTLPSALPCTSEPSQALLSLLTGTDDCGTQRGTASPQKPQFFLGKTWESARSGLLIQEIVAENRVNQAMSHF